MNGFGQPPCLTTLARKHCAVINDATRAVPYFGGEKTVKDRPLGSTDSER
jgi:hypothetical protein